ncbi:MAG: acetyl-CoA carboxylase carboxyltransferase subunit alpha [Planctomycetota bacterium]|nr:MAG: acetyl-CoA carboxylase carboxyltransferase subunit alpha [Planctomycetota bacterium]
MSSLHRLPFEAPLLELEQRIDALEAVSRERQALAHEDAQAPDLGEEFARLRQAHRRMLEKIYSSLEPWDVVRVARHPARPQTRDYIRLICTDFCELHGDRRFRDDPAIVTGFARIGSIKCLVVGHQKGRDTQEKLACHFGCPHPEGYRKALAKMKLAEKFNLPIVSFVDTPGAYPGVGAEERGQAQAIAENLREMSRLRTPIVAVVIGEGGSGGALGVAVADRVAMLEHAWYSVISPEGCAAILWKEANEANNRAAARALKLTAKDNLELGLVDEVLPEPLGGAHRDPQAGAEIVKGWLIDRLRELKRFKPANLPRRRYERWRRIGVVREQREAEIAAGTADAGQPGRTAAQPSSAKVETPGPVASALSAKPHRQTPAER